MDVEIIFVCVCVCAIRHRRIVIIFAQVQQILNHMELSQPFNTYINDIMTFIDVHGQFDAVQY